MKEDEAPPESVVDLSRVAKLLGVPTPVWTADDEAEFDAWMTEGEKTGIMVIPEREPRPA